MASFEWPPQGGGSGSGTVTSVGLADSSTSPIFTVTGSPVTTSGTLTLTLNTEAANTVFAGPTSGTSAQPTFRSLVTADLPSGTGTVTSVSVVSANGLTGTVANSTTTPAITLSTTVSGLLFGNAGVISAASTTGAGNVVLSTNPTLVGPTLGTPLSVTLTNAMGLPLTSGVTGVLPLANGGTNATSAAAAFNNLSPLTTTGDMIYEVSTATADRLPIGSTGNVLTVSGGIPTWAPPATGGTVTTVSVVSTNGFAGTVATASSTPAITISTTITGILQGNGSAISAATTTGTGNVVLATSPTLVTPALGTPTSVVLTSATGLPLTTGVTGILPIANGGTNAVTAAAAFNNLNPMTTTGDLIYESGTNTASRLGIGSTNQVLTVSGGIPSWQSASSTLTVPTVQKFLTNGSITGWVFTVTSANATVGATYTTGGNTYTVLQTIAAATLLFTSQTSSPAASGTLTKASGTGDATITFSNSQALATYTTPTTPVPLYLEIEFAGGGGGGSGGDNTGATAGGTGGPTYFGSSLLIATGGVGGGVSGSTSQGSAGGAGGTTTINSPALSLLALTGGAGNSGGVGNSTIQSAGLSGGGNALGGAGNGGFGGTSPAAGGAGAANTGAGGGGGGIGNALLPEGAGGGAGGYGKAIVPNPTTSYVYSVGSSGAAGLGGSGAAAGGAGARGIVTVKECYQ